MGRHEPVKGTFMDAAEQFIRSLLVLALVVEARDPYTAGHLWRVSRYSRMVADHGGLSPEEGLRISLGGFLHDLGKDRHTGCHS